MAATAGLIDNVAMSMVTASPDGGSSPEDVADRFVMLREALRFETQVAFAERLGIEVSALNHIELGRRPPSLAVANRLRLLYRIPLDFVFHGDRSGFSLEIASAIPFLEDWRMGRTGRRGRRGAPARNGTDAVSPRK